MMGSINQLANISADLIGAASKRKKITRHLKECGFLPLGKGAFLGFRSSDTASGLLIEGSSADTYISSFLLPIFDRLTFINWSLGRRLVHCSADNAAEIESGRAIDAYRDELLPVALPSQIIDYVTRSKKNGFYSYWAIYLSLLREGNLAEARRYLDDEKKSKLHPSVIKRLEEVEPLVITGNTAKVAAVLRMWEAISENILGSGDYSI